jgi:hypothetical protein
MAAEIGIGHCVLQEMEQILEYLKVCAPWVPPLLMDKQKFQQKSVSSQLCKGMLLKVMTFFTVL